jgi:hypothetical protein
MAPRMHAFALECKFTCNSVAGVVHDSCHGLMAGGGHKLPRVSPGPAMHYPFTLCGRATPKTAVSGVARRHDGRPAAVSYPCGHHTPYAYEFHAHFTHVPHD